MGVSLFCLGRSGETFAARVFPTLIFSGRKKFCVDNGERCGDSIFDVLVRSGRETLRLCGTVGKSDCSGPRSIRVIVRSNNVSLSIEGSTSFVISTELDVCRRRSAIYPGVPIEDLVCFDIVLSSVLDSGGGKAGDNGGVCNEELMGVPAPRFIMFCGNRRRRPRIRRLGLSSTFRGPASRPGLRLGYGICGVGSKGGGTVVRSYN